jgi:uncharacterized protein (AIM24 family)
VVVLPSSASLNVGQSQQFAAVLYVNGTQQDAVFSWSATSGIGTVDQTGKFTATNVGDGLVVASCFTSGTPLSGSATVKVANFSTPPSNNSTSAYLIVIPQNATLGVGQTQQFTAYLVANGAPNEVQVEWSTAGGVGTIDSNGLFTATSEGSGMVIAKYSESITNVVLTGIAGVIVTEGISPPPPNATAYLLVIPQNATLEVGQTQQFTAYLVSNGSIAPMPVTASWSATGGVGSIDSNGLFTATSEGSGQAVAKYHYAPLNVDLTGTANVLVTNSTSPPPPPASIARIEVTPGSVSLFVGQSQQFSALAYDSQGALLGSVPNENLSWSATPGIGTINSSGLFSAASAGSGLVMATYTGPSVTWISANASVSVSEMAPAPIGIGGGSGSGGGTGSAGGSFKTATTVSFTCAGKIGDVKITVFDSNEDNVTVDIFYLGASVREKVFTKAIAGSTTLSFIPEKAGNYALHVSVGADQTSANFFVPHCGAQAANVTQNITVRLEPARELVFSKLVHYPGGFSKRFSVYKITDGQDEEFESYIVLYFNYTGNETKRDFDILDSVPSSVLARSSQIMFADKPSAMATEPRFEWKVGAVSKGSRLSYAYSFSRPLTEQMIGLFEAPSIREAGAAEQGQGGGLLAASIGPIFGLTLPLVGVLLAFLVLLSLLYFFLFRKKKEEE